MSAEPATQPAPAPEAKVDEKAAEQTESKPAENTTEKPAETTTEKPAESTDKPADAPTEPAAAAEPAKEEPASKEQKEERKEEEKEEQKEGPAKPDYITKTPALGQLFDRLPAILEKAGHTEMWGVQLKDFNDIPTVNVLIKFLRANEGNVKQAEEQLTKALEWRKKLNVVDLADNAKFSKKFDGLGYITSYNDPKQGNVVFNWNIYGAVKDVDGTFGNVTEFIKWRTALMERAVRELKIDESTKVIDYSGEDPYQMIQVHDYLNVSFLRLNPNIRAASKETIEAFSLAYPELLREKFFVNVPAIMSWMFTALKVFLSKNTIRKFHPISNGANLAKEFPFSDELPKTYGGKGGELKDVARSVPVVEDEPAKEAPKEEAKDDSKKEEQSKEEGKEQPKEEAKTESKEQPKEEAKEEPQQESKESQEAAKEEPAKAEEPAKTEEAAAASEPAKEELAKENAEAK